ncbi:hypothetical protein Zmor_008058 [Zophobas morio]|uniref:Uncharacterized protein n=1 Tax=Zophobas morio TaxID=2755281 RepID=A0AA38J1Q9_9CUCU|nr:hypothetical protein Zmor_008058 [Zophobas morio]
MSKYLKIVAVGDHDSKKTELLLKYTSNCNDLQHYNKFLVPQFQNNVYAVVVDRIERVVQFVDAPAEDDYKTLRKEVFENADCILLCYSINSKPTFKNVSKKWVLEVRQHAPLVPIVLVATDTETRNNNAAPISTEQGENLKLLIGAYAFVECSTRHFLGVDDVFIEAIRSTYPH